MNTDTYDIVGYRIISPLHLATLLAYAGRQTKARKSVDVLVVVSKGPWDKHILQKSLPVLPDIKVTYIDEDEFEHTQSRLWPVYLLLKPLVSLGSWITGKELTPVCSPTMVSIRFSLSSWGHMLRFRPVVLDEGIGSFNTRYIFQHEAERRTSNPAAQALLVRTYSLLLNNLFILNGSRVSLFNFQKDEPIVNKDIADSYKATFLNSYRLRNTPTTIPPRTALILTQPFSEMGICSEDELLDAVRSLARQITDTGANPVIKPHPVEPPDKYEQLGIRSLNYDGPAEEIFAALNDHITEVFGFNSTSLILASALFNIKATSMRPSWNSSFYTALDTEASLLFTTYTSARPCQ